MLKLNLFCSLWLTNLYANKRVISNLKMKKAVIANLSSLKLKNQAWQYRLGLFYLWLYLHLWWKGQWNGGAMRMWGANTFCDSLFSLQGTSVRIFELVIYFGSGSIILSVMNQFSLIEPSLCMYIGLILVNLYL